MQIIFIILCTKTKSSQTKKNSHLCLPFPPFPSPIQNSWKALSLNVLILGRWDMGASITEEDAGFELLVVMRFTHAVIVITRQRVC
jgi:hypothetical protein